MWELLASKKVKSRVVPGRIDHVIIPGRPLPLCEALCWCFDVHRALNERSLITYDGGLDNCGKFGSSEIHVSCFLPFCTKQITRLSRSFTNNHPSKARMIISKLPR